MNAQEIKALRVSRGWRQRDLASHIGVHRLTVLRWERGDVQPSGMALRALLAVAQQCPPAYS